MQHLDEGTIHAYVDGALSPVEARRVQEHLSSCASCEAQVAMAHGLIAASSRIVSHLDAVPGKVIPAVKRKTSRWMSSPWPTAIAATLVIGIGLVSTRDKRKNPVLPVAIETTAGVVRRSAPESMPLSQPPRQVEPQQNSVADSVTSKPVVTAPGPIQLPPANAAAQKTSVSAAQPAPAPLPANREDRARLSRTRNDAADEIASARSRASAPGRAVGSVAGGAALGAAVGSAPPVAAAAESRQVAEAPVRVDSITPFVGCYERIGTSNQTGIKAAPSRYAVEELFTRFALMDEAAPTPGQFAVRRLDAAGRPDALIFGAGWTVLRDRATVRNSRGEIVAILFRSDTLVRSATVRVISCRK